MVGAQGHRLPAPARLAASPGSLRTEQRLSRTGLRSARPREPEEISDMCPFVSKHCSNCCKAGLSGASSARMGTELKVAFAVRRNVPGSRDVLMCVGDGNF